MPRKLLSKFDVRAGTVLLMLLAVAGAAWGCYALVDELRIHDPERVRVAAGSAAAAISDCAVPGGAGGGQAGIEMEIVPSAGFEESMQQLADGTVDMALGVVGARVRGSGACADIGRVGCCALRVLVRRGWRNRDCRSSRR